MRDHVTLPRAILRIFAEYAIIFPLAYLITGLLDPPITWILLLLLPFCALVGAVLRRYLSWGMPQLILGLVLSVGITAAISLQFAVRANPANYVLPILLSPFVYYRGKQLAQNDWHVVTPYFVPCLLLVINLALIAFINYTDALGPFVPVLRFAGPLSLVVAYFTMNTLSRRNLAEDQRYEGAARQTAVPRNLATQNRALVVGLLILGSLLSCLPFLVTLAKWLLQIIGQILAFLFGLLVALAPQAPEVTGESADYIPPEEFTYTENPFWDQFFTILMGVVFVVILLVLLVLLLIAIRKGWKLLKELLMNMAEKRGLIGADTLEFDDTNDAILNLRDLPKKYWNDFKNRVSDMTRRTLRWNEMETESDRVKYLYRASLRRARKSGYTHRNFYTPHEALQDAARNLSQIADIHQELAQQYDAVRYGEQDPPSGAATQLKNRAGL